MKPSNVFLISLMELALSACSVQPTQPSATPGETRPNDANKIIITTSDEPPLTLTKNGKTLNLVRIMDGIACKNNLEGAQGVFLIYASNQDMERIAQVHGEKIFADFEMKIQEFSKDALLQALEAMNLSDNPFSLGKDVEKQDLTEQLSHNFHTAAARPIERFEKDTTLTIDIRTYTPSLVFFQTGCAAQLDED